MLQAAAGFNVDTHVNETEKGIAGEGATDDGFAEEGTTDENLTADRTTGEAAAREVAPRKSCYRRC